MSDRYDRMAEGFELESHSLDLNVKIPPTGPLWRARCECGWEDGPWGDLPSARRLHRAHRYEYDDEEGMKMTTEPSYGMDPMVILGLELVIWLVFVSIIVGWPW